jgi:hypothetical protein
MTRHRTLFAALGVTALLVGCSRKESMTCAPTERYSTAQSVQPVQIPDDLSPPDESGALRLPPDVGASRRAATEPPCLESPPSFFADRPAGRSGRPGAAEPAPAEAPAEAADDPERSIDN